MNRRAVGLSRRPGVDEKFRTLVGALLVGVTILLLAFGRGGPASAIEAPPDDTVAIESADEPPLAEALTTPTSIPSVETRPPITANDFIPEERDLTSCIGVLERPGCGSESRGGWRQTLILVAIFGGLAIVFGNVARGVRRNRQEQQRSS